MAFGLALSLGFQVPGLVAGGDGPPVRVELLGDALAAAWPEGTGRVVMRQRLPRFGDEMVLESDEERGHRVSTGMLGAYVLSPAGSWVGCAPAVGVEGWVWQRFLCGQILPLAAVLRGLEVFHTSAVVLRGGAAVAFMADSGVGKTSLALRLVERGSCELLTDDVLAVSAADPGAVSCFPGPGLVNVARGESSAVRGPGAAVLGDDGRKLRVRVEPRREPAPLRAFCFLARVPAGEPLEISRADPSPRRLLAATFNFAIRTPERLARQLDVCAAIGRTAEVIDIRFPPSVDAAELAERVEAELA